MAIRRLCGLAERVALGSGVGAATDLLAGTVVGIAAARTADGSSEVSGGRPSRGGAKLQSRTGVDREVEGAEPERRGDALHDAFERLPGLAEPVQPSGR